MTRNTLNMICVILIAGFASACGDLGVGGQHLDHDPGEILLPTPSAIPEVVVAEVDLRIPAFEVVDPSPEPSADPTADPTVEPTPTPTPEPSTDPTPGPTADPDLAPNCIESCLAAVADDSAWLEWINDLMGPNSGRDQTSWAMPPRFTADDDSTILRRESICYRRDDLRSCLPD